MARRQARIPATAVVELAGRRGTGLGRWVVSTCSAFELAEQIGPASAKRSFSIRGVAYGVCCGAARLRRRR
jgi:hypothetical protein